MKDMCMLTGRLTPRHLIWLLIGLVAGVAGYQVLIPQPFRIDAAIGQAEIHFFTDRRNVLFATDCLIVGWDVEHIESVYLNKNGKVGTGSQLVCLSEGQPTLTVNMTDGTSQNYILPVLVLADDQQFQITVSLLVVFLLTLVSVFRRLLPILVAVLLGVVQTTDFTHRLPGEIGGILSLWALILLAALVYARRLFPPRLKHEQSGLRSAAPASLPSRAWSLGFALAMIGVGATIYIVNPLGKYDTTIFTTFANPARSTKMNFYAQLEHAPDIVIIGSSLVFTISPAYITTKLGYSAFNASLDGGRITDAITQLRFFADHGNRTFPKVIFFEVDPGIDTSYSWSATTLQPVMIRYMDFPVALYAVQDRLEGLLNLQQLSQSVYILNHSADYLRPQITFQADGGAAPLESQLDDEKLKAIIERNITTDGGDATKPLVSPDASASLFPIQESIKTLDTVIAIARQHRSTLIVYLAPVHPAYYRAVFMTSQFWVDAIAGMDNYMRKLTQANDDIFFLNFSDPLTVNGLDFTGLGFWDGRHMTPYNNQRILDAATETIRVAYQVSIAKRAKS
jgi:hypothetical protein